MSSLIKQRETNGEKTEPQIYLKKSRNTTKKETEKFFFFKLNILNCKGADNSRLRRALNFPFYFSKFLGLA